MLSILAFDFGELFSLFAGAAFFAGGGGGGIITGTVSAIVSTLVSMESALIIAIVSLFCALSFATASAAAGSLLHPIKKRKPINGIAFFILKYRAIAQYNP